MSPSDETQHLGTEDTRTVADVLAPLLPAQAPRGPLLCLAAHPDDETLGASWLLRRSPGCHVVHVTDGAPRDAALRSAPSTREAYARLREREAIAALAHAGVPLDNLLLLGAVDQETVEELVTLTGCLVALLKALRPALLVTHPYEGGHPDHDSAAFISHAAVALLSRQGRTAPTLLEMTSYHRRDGVLRTGEFLPAPDGRPVATVAFSEAERARKQRMLDCYATQARVLESFSFPVDYERYRAAPPYDFTRPPHEGMLQYESFGWELTGARWRERARGALEEMKLPEAPWH